MCYKKRNSAEITLEWTDEDIDHVRRHNIDPREVESIFGSKIYKKKKSGQVQLLGKTIGGRILFMVLERTGRRLYRVITAREATVSEKSLYVKRAK